MRRILIVIALISTVACATEDAVSDQWDEFVAQNNTCEVVADCASVYPGCPLGCSTAVSASAVDAAELRAGQLISQYEFGGISCDYDCAVTLPLQCEANQCSYASE